MAGTRKAATKKLSNANITCEVLAQGTLGVNHDNPVSQLSPQERHDRLLTALADVVSRFASRGVETANTAEADPVDKATSVCQNIHMRTESTVL